MEIQEAIEHCEEVCSRHNVGERSYIIHKQLSDRFKELVELKNCKNIGDRSDIIKKYEYNYKIGLTIDESISFCEDFISSNGGCDQCLDDQRQIIQWLRELKELKGLKN